MNGITSLSFNIPKLEIMKKHKVQDIAENLKETNKFLMRDKEVNKIIEMYLSDNSMIEKLIDSEKQNNIVNSCLEIKRDGKNTIIYSQKYKDFIIKLIDKVLDIRDKKNDLRVYLHVISES
ncbi:hypothetical protein [Ferroplasma sp.]|uniref:hypothetical protein n=1 Tax=Ferroplasma sp. TaxID=2591003 RepID=UPI00307FCB95